MPFCPNCAKEVGEEDRFCRGCGQTLQGPTVQKPISQAPSVPEVELVRSTLARHIKAGEKVLWSAKPVKIPFIIPSLATIPFGLFFLGFSIFWMWGAASAGAGPFTLFGLFFVLMGLGLTVGPSIWQLMRYQNTEYMITDQRIITQTGAIGLDTRFVDFDKIQEVYVKVGFIDKMFGTGTVLAVTAGFVYVDSGRGAISMRPSLAALKEPYEVQKLLQEAIEKSRTAQTR